jgi:hypothetical protein
MSNEHDENDQSNNQQGGGSSGGGNLPNPDPDLSAPQKRDDGGSQNTVRK